METTIEYFNIPVKCKVPYEERYEIYDDCGFIILPKTYTEKGEPTRLVISCHGAGGSVFTDDAQVVQQTTTLYLLANGFAVMDMAGIPKEYSEKYGVHYFNNIGSPMAIDAYVSGYKYVTEKYNIKKEVIVHGGSMGGISSANLILSGRIPVLLHTCYCPVLDTYNEIFLHPWCGTIPKVALGKIYSLDKDSEGNLIYNEEKVGENNPITNEKTKKYSVPVRFWQCADDEVVSPEVTKRFVDIVNKNGGDAKLIILPAGGHEPQDYGEFIENPSGNTEINGIKLKITQAIEGMFKEIIKYGM